MVKHSTKVLDWEYQLMRVCCTLETFGFEVNMASEFRILAFIFRYLHLLDQITGSGVPCYPSVLGFGRDGKAVSRKIGLTF